MKAYTQKEIEKIQERVQTSIESIRGYLKKDGGDLRIHAVTSDLIVELELLGNCSSCTMGEMTMRLGIETAIRQAVPEVKEVRQVGSKS